VEPNAGQVAPLTGLRGVAAGSVLIAHALDVAFSYSGRHYWEPSSSRLSYFGMSLFFVLSGFVISYNYTPLFQKERPGVALWRFFVARFARLYPLYALSIVVYGHIPSEDSLTLISYLTLTQSWLNVEMAAFAPDWSLSTEWFFYFAFAAVALGLGPARRPLRTMLAVSVATAATLPLLFGPLANGTTSVAHTLFWRDTTISAEAFRWVTYYAPYTRLPEFLLGMLAARAFVLKRRLGVQWAYIGAGWCAAVVFISPITRLPGLTSMTSNFIFAPALALVMLVCCQRQNIMSRALSSAPALFFGEISYSVYIWGWAVMWLLSNKFVSPAPTPLAFLNSTVNLILIVLVTTAFAYGSFVLIECPARRWLRHLFAFQGVAQGSTVAATVNTAAADSESPR
jgi:peptidoglycan/LPS O-acetylase OafA/YrhL